MSEFTSISKITGPAYYPRDVFERLGGKPTEQEAVWSCTACGEIQPRPVAVRGYLSGKCKCQQGEMHQERLAVWKELQEELTLFDFERLGGKPTEQEAVWSCAACGRIKPFPVTIIGYLPGKCKCQKQEETRQERLTVWKEQEERRVKRVARCYTWLSPDKEPVPYEWQTMTLDAFQQEQEMQSKAFMVALEFIEKRSGNVIFWASTNGSGKTHLATAICNHFLQDGLSCLFAGTYDLFRAIEARWDSPEDYTDTYSDLVRQAVRCDLLVLDDISRVRKYRKEFDEILDGRHQRRKPTIITLNADKVLVTDREIIGVTEFIGLAASDRLCDISRGGLVCCEMHGKSWRRRMH